MADQDDVQHKYLDAASAWYESNRSKNGAINTNVMNAGLVVSQMLAGGLYIDDDMLYSNGKSQVRGLSGATIARILARHGENRTFTREGGRTSRGTVLLAASFRDVVNGVEVPEGVNVDAKHISHSLEEYFVGCVRSDYFDKQRIAVDIKAEKPVSFIVNDILLAAAERSDKPTGAVLQHLVGAKLELRFPNEDIGLDQANAADLQTDREGDFQVGTTAFHVTVAPMEKLVNRCIENKKAGFRPVIITLEGRMQAAKQMAENVGMADSILVQSAEAFIGTNIEEISIYDGDKIREGVARLVRKYNERIEAVEVDKSLMIDEPRWLVKILENEE